jgi:hypothetical protein
MPSALASAIFAWTGVSARHRDPSLAGQAGTSIKRPFIHKNGQTKKVSK